MCSSLRTACLSSGPRIRARERLHALWQSCLTVARSVTTLDVRSVGLARQTSINDLRRGKRRQIMMGRLGGGVAVAVALAVLMGVPSIGGIATWKWALALAGFALFVWGGLSDRQNSR